MPTGWTGRSCSEPVIPADRLGLRPASSRSTACCSVRRAQSACFPLRCNSVNVVLEEIMLRVGLAVLGIALVMTSGCGPAGATRMAPEVTQQPHGPKRITMAFGRELDLAHHQGQGRALLKTLVNPGLSVADGQDVRRPALAEAVPTVENGLWKTFADGRMETTWTIREG